MARPDLEVADIFRKHGESYRRTYGSTMRTQEYRVMRAIEICRTAALGGHVDRCDHCGHQVISYNSCRNRHCPKCQALEKAKWLQARSSELLPVEYFHVVFTLPQTLAAIALQNKRVVYNILFRAASQSLLTIATDSKHLGAQIGFTSILHTWGQNLMLHPHLHCIVPGGGLSPGGKEWISCRKGFFLPVRVLSRLYRRLFLDLLKNAYEEGLLECHGNLERLSKPGEFDQFLRASGKAEWVVYAKPPFGGAEKVLDYLARYTHRIAISNHRLVSMANGKITFAWKDYKHEGKSRNMTLGAHEFIRRFLLHVLPNGFMRIRHYGFLANRRRKERIRTCRKILHVADVAETAEIKAQDWASIFESVTGVDPLACPRCQRGHMVRIQSLLPMFHIHPSCKGASRREEPP